ncbi:MAG: histidinol-phosphate transaminase [Dehalococcoidia bacterium]
MIPVRPELLSIEATPHGSLAASEAPDRTGVLDLSANTSPLGPPPAVLDAIRNARVDAYPEPDAVSFRRAVAGQLGVPADWVAAGNGAAELIWLAALASAGPGRNGLIVGPTFGEYARAIQVAGASPVEIRAEAPEFIPPIDRITDALDRLHPALLFLCNPNNPTGSLIAAAELAALADRAPDTLLAIDEAYLPFTDAPDLLALLDRPNLLLIRSLTKAYAIPGVRIGYALGQTTGVLRRIAPPWSVGAPAIAAGLAALADPGWPERGRCLAREGLDRVASELARRGLSPVPSAANFLIVAVPNAAAVRRTLFERGVLVRDCASFGLPGYLRIAAGPPEAISRLLSAWPDEEGMV